VAADISPLQGDVNSNVREMCHFVIVFGYDQKTEKSKKIQDASTSNSNPV
jgi:hypothetical protein